MTIPKKQATELPTETAVPSGGYIIGANGNALFRIQEASLLRAAPSVVLEDRKGAGISAQTFTANTWETREIGVEINDPDGICTINGAFEFTCTVDMWAEWQCQGRGIFTTRLYNVTDVQYVAQGMSAYMGGTSYGLSCGGAPMEAGKTYRIEQRTDTASNGGTPANLGPETYARVLMWRSR